MPRWKPQPGWPMRRALLSICLIARIRCFRMREGASSRDSASSLLSRA